MIANKIFRGSLKWCTCLQIFIMSILIFWIYGVERLCDDIHFISGSQPTKYWKIAWYLMPLITGVTRYVQLSILGYPDSFTLQVCAFYVDTSTFGETDLTIWVNFIASAVMLCPIPIFAMLEVFRYLQQHVSFI